MTMYLIKNLKQKNTAHKKAVNVVALIAPIFFMAAGGAIFGPLVAAIAGGVGSVDMQAFLGGS
jgi:hypothetical protein